MGITDHRRGVWADVSEDDACQDRGVPNPTTDHRRGVWADVSEDDACQDRGVPHPTSIEPDIVDDMSDNDGSQVDVDGAAQLETWLRELDNGRGSLLQYLEPLLLEFGDTKQLVAAVNSTDAEASVVDSVDPLVFEVLGVELADHKLLLA